MKRLIIALVTCHSLLVTSYASDVITVIQPQPTQITITSSTAPQVTINTSGNDTLQMIVPGPQGIPGQQGLQGETGAQGVQGIQGVQGETGAPGTTDHTLLTNIGTTTHSAIDTALTRLATTSGTNTGDQDLSGLVVSGGKSGGQTINGDTAAGGGLTLSSTSSGTKGPINAGGLVLDESTYANTLNVGKTTEGVTDLLINPAVKINGYLLDLQIAGTSIFRVAGGGITSTRTMSLGTNYLSAAGVNAAYIKPSAGNAIFSLQSNNFTNSTIATKMNHGVYSGGAGVAQTAVLINPTYNQSGTASATDLIISRIETAVGSGPQQFISLRGGAAGTTEKFAISNTGALSTTLATTTTAPAAGGADALPATPAGYAEITINGTVRKIPYY